MLQRLKNKLSEEHAGIKLNYLTLKIDDKLAQKDFEVHKTAVQNRMPFFWIVQLCSTINILNMSYRTFAVGENI